MDIRGGSLERGQGGFLAIGRLSCFTFCRVLSPKSIEAADHDCIKFYAGSYRCFVYEGVVVMIHWHYYIFV